jgi:hypothetical protein
MRQLLLLLVTDWSQSHHFGLIIVCNSEVTLAFKAALSRIHAHGRILLSATAGNFRKLAKLIPRMRQYRWPKVAVSLI